MVKGAAGLPTTFEARMTEALRRRGAAVDARAALGALIDAFASFPDALSFDEREFAVSAGVPSEAFSDERGAASAVWLAASLMVTAQREAGWLTDEQVMKLLRIDEDSLNALCEVEKLHAATLLDGRRGFPRWQFSSARELLPHVREVVAACPHSYSALDIDTVMESPTEELDGWSPKEWLCAVSAARPLPALLEYLTDLDR